VVGIGLLLVSLFVLAHFGFKRQFRSDTVFRDVPETFLRAAGYVFILLTGMALWRWRRSPAMPPWVRTAGMGLALLFPFLVMVPSAKLLLLLAPGLGLGSLWMLRLVRMGEERPHARLTELLESEWFLFVASLAWVCLESWVAAMAPLIDQQRGALGWTLNRAPWFLAVALVYQLIRAKEKGSRLSETLSMISVLAALPPLVLAHHSDHFNLLVWLALLAMACAAVNRRSTMAVFQLGAATYALTTLLSSASHAFSCGIVCGTVWAFMMLPIRPERPRLDPSLTDQRPRSQLIPVLSALALCFAWLTVQQQRDGSFSFSDIEVTVAFYGNPTHDIGRAALQVSARFILPMVLLLIPLRLTAGSARILGVVLALVLVHIAFLLVGFLATQSQFYTPYRLAGELAHFLVLIGSVPLLFVIFGRRLPCLRDDPVRIVP
jgi:hypothetical protein